MQQSESRALHVRDKHRGIFDRTTEAFDGEVIHYYGDGTLSIFSSAVKSVRCAIEMQKLFQEEPAIPVRIGIHMGDIITSADDIVGDSVNLASRVESMAVAGSVLISDKVYEEIRNQEDFEVKELGTFQFKNDRSKRKIYAMVSQGLIVPEINQLKGRIEKKPDSEIATGFSIRNLKMQRILMVGLFLLIAGVFGSMYLKKVSKSRWAELEAISQIEKWSEERKYKMAFEMAMEADQYIPDDPKLDELINSISEVVSIETEPPGARVFRKLVAGNETEWENVGETPLDSILIYRGESIWRFEKGGYEPVIRLHDHEWRDPVLLFQKGQIPEEMVHVPASFYDRVLIPLIRVDSVPHVPGFLIDRFEVTNQEFKVFIDSNGYNRKEFWQHPFLG
jgi:hypothetical protein